MTIESTQDTQAEEDTPFALFLYELNKGRPNRELGAKLKELVAEVLKTRKAGTLQLTLTVKPQANVDGAVIIADEIKRKLPAFDRKASIYFADETGALHRDNPTQPTLFEQIVTGSKEITK
ncbi:hypothetical protein [Amycolatopsis sp. YIM 10]|uniref:hypothetical protein n=1 Tax=Amycolatopsis sp. YIM 10 TaxID=2653857 RepID=UPI0012A92D1D|nr:hypothetical protein [Amycolatopsis sp. YIM 10]QFU87852.1 hypothetical protein YIM_13330 [Amycolatopsis sp. YIM 10]QFU94835.1 hypothetical protein YIM_48550 [Amycolatopsis sp. YIM 10]